MIRYCFVCGAEIHECMGYVVAGDILLVVEGLIDFKDVRERCALCVEKASFVETYSLIYANNTQGLF